MEETNKYRQFKRASIWLIGIDILVSILLLFWFAWLFGAFQVKQSWSYAVAGFMINTQIFLGANPATLWTLGIVMAVFLLVCIAGYKGSSPEEQTNGKTWLVLTIFFTLIAVGALLLEIDFLYFGILPFNHY